MILAQKQTYRPTEQDRNPRNKPMLIWSINLQQKRHEYTMGKRQSLQQMVLAKQDSHMQKNGTRPISYTIHKNKLKID